jgi:hypothetical protein
MSKGMCVFAVLNICVGSIALVLGSFIWTVSLFSKKKTDSDMYLNVSETQGREFS